MRRRNFRWVGLALVLILLACSTTLASAQSETWLPVVGSGGAAEQTQTVEPAPAEEPLGGSEPAPADPGAPPAQPGEVAETIGLPAEAALLPQQTGSDSFVTASPDAPAAYDVATWRVVNSVGIGTDAPGAPLDIRFGATGSLVAGTPLGNGPGWIFFAANGHRRDLTAWNGGYYFGASPNAGAAPVSQFVIRESGYVGIGTASPAAPLEVNFGVTGRTLAATPLGNGPGWIFYAANGHRRDLTAWNGGFYFGASANAGAAPSYQLVVRESGNVGIGTYNPAGKLEVNFGATGRVVAGTPLGNGPGWIFNAANGHRRDLVAWNGGLYFGAAPNLGPAAPQVALVESGFLGVGTTNPLAKLHVVNGNIRVTNGSFIDDGVALNVPDYVFEPDYALMSLGDLRAFVEAEKHLPNVPSASEIKANGLNMSQFNMALLEKAEELTVYTLQQQEQIDSLQAQLAAQADQITAQADQIAALQAQMAQVLASR